MVSNAVRLRNLSCSTTTRPTPVSPAACTASFTFTMPVPTAAKLPRSSRLQRSWTWIAGRAQEQ